MLIVKPQNTSHDISGDRKLKFLKNVPSLHYCKGLDTPDSNGDILRHMLCRKDLRILDLRLNEKTQPIILSEIASTSYMTVKSLSVVLDDHRRPSLVKVLQSMPGLQALSMTGAIDATRMIELAAYSSQLTELACQLRLSGDGHERFGEAYRALGKHCPRLRSLQISSLSSIDEPRTLKGSLRLIGHALPSIERLSLPLRLPLEDLITLHTNEDLPRLEQLEVRALTVESDEFLGLVHSAQTLRRIRATHRLSPSCGPVRFPRLRYLNMGSTGLFMSNASGLADSESVIDWVLDAMPKLCNVQYDSMDDIQRAAFARFEAKLQKRPQTEPPNDVHDRILHEIYRAGVRQLARQGKDEAQSSSRTVA